MSTSYKQAAKILSKELEEKGFHCRFDRNHAHPRLYIGSRDSERFVVLTRSGNYDHGNLLDIKRQDIRRDVLPYLPTPETTPMTNGSDEKGALPTDIQPAKVCSIKATIMGKGVLGVYVPKEVIPKDKPNAQAYLTSDNRLYLTFMETDGKKFGSTPSTGIVVYCFGKKEVQFKYASRTPKGFKTPRLHARIKDGSLCSDEPVPNEILSEPTKVKTKPTKVAFSIDDGQDLLQMLNEWIGQAEVEGFEPRVNVKDNRIVVQIAEKKWRDL